MKLTEAKADSVDNKCPRCRGTGADPEQPRVPLPLAPVLGERQFQVGANRCHQCGGSGRIPNGAP
jgi:hypothetical protein